MRNYHLIKRGKFGVIFYFKISLIGYVIGDRSEKTFRRLSRNIPNEYLKCKCFSDYEGHPVRFYAILRAKGNHCSSELSTGQ